MGNYYVVNITHPTACIVLNEIDTERKTVMNMFATFRWVTVVTTRKQATCESSPPPTRKSIHPEAYT
ncbi:CLUMA_CG020550, isoform A [Clunio marinus]|uniref:CLUMA_CG020550, isoform A n=1 Tax=Clunio marinus TaxID=568069 RepID=A0A1J1J9A2_9DIPT|nr:CLUMA_CG020550, isoform A [Clunio marinus]